MQVNAAKIMRFAEKAASFIQFILNKNSSKPM
jgi:hypothetical protein